MIAYNTTRLKNVFARQQAAQYFEEGCITREELTGISNKHPDTFYSPNFFIRIGLFTLTVVILLFSLGLIALLFLNSIEDAAGGKEIPGDADQRVRHLRSGADSPDRAVE